MSLIVGSFSSISSGPRPNVSSSTSLDQPLALVAVQQRVFGVAEVLDDQADFAAQRVAFQLADPRQVELVDELAVDALLDDIEIGIVGRIVGSRGSGRGFHHDILGCDWASTVPRRQATKSRRVTPKRQRRRRTFRLER